MPLTLLLVRHGETEYNAEGRYQGQRDIPLSDTGRAQARRLGARLAAVYAAAAANTDRQLARPLPGPPIAAYASDLQRAHETARLIVDALPGSGLAVERLTALRERHFGGWEGLAAAEIRARFAGDTDPHDGETWPEVWERMNGALSAIWQAHGADARQAPLSGPTPARRVEAPAPVLVVGHGGSLRAFLCRALGVGHEHVRRFRLDNASLSIIDLWGDDPNTVEGASPCSTTRLIWPPPQIRFVQRAASAGALTPRCSSFGQCR
jgi:broad specificity phosphatase PhoE